MKELKQVWQERVVEALRAAAVQNGMEAELVQADQVIASTPPNPELGDIAFPMFPFAKIFRKSPADVVQQVMEYIITTGEASREKGKGKDWISAAGPYMNVSLDISSLAWDLFERINASPDSYGKNGTLSGTKVMIEFSCPNTNKPLHLGHLRNDSIGESVARILAENGAEVRKVNLINDRGIHICKSMLAYQKFGEGKTPESEGIKGDHFVGDYYVKYDQWSKDDKTADQQVRKMLQDWEKGVPEVTALWEKMNRWAIEGIEETYQATGVSFDKIYYESETFRRGREEVLKGLEQGVFYSEEDGSVWVDLSEIHLDKKVLLRSDGTSLYLTQDIGTAIARHDDWPFHRLIYVVASEQKYHFKVLFFVLKKLGFQWAEDLYHLSYGMVNLPEGKMKSREGTVVDADDLHAELKKMAAEEIRQKEREADVGNVEQTASAVALAALNYYLLQVSPSRDMIFDPKESISFNGNTGPYLQYMGARISSMMRKYDDRKEEFADGKFRPGLLEVTEERELVKLLAAYPEAVLKAGEEMNPSVITSYLYEVSRIFSRYYHDNPILHNEDHDLVVTRMELAGMILQVLKNAYRLVGIPFLDRM
jgi:arginyl-tRNA synthetase